MYIYMIYTPSCVARKISVPQLYFLPTGHLSRSKLKQRCGACVPNRNLRQRMCRCVIPKKRWANDGCLPPSKVDG